MIGITRIGVAVRRRFFSSYRRVQDAFYGRFGTYHAVAADDLPSDPRPGILYLVGEDGRHWIAAMRCPCGCGEALEMNLLRDAHPVWEVGVDRARRPTLAPSVWPREYCGAHFYLRAGKIQWV